MPAVLQKLARHADIATTMSYYVALGADEIAADLWANHGAAGNNHGNIAPKRPSTNILTEYRRHADRDQDLARLRVAASLERQFRLGAVGGRFSRTRRRRHD
jgi:hypothetical protein